VIVRGKLGMSGAITLRAESPLLGKTSVVLNSVVPTTQIADPPGNGTE